VLVRAFLFFSGHFSKGVYMAVKSPEEKAMEVAVISVTCCIRKGNNLYYKI
jgi:hypothetical protein